jgi:hypothetical protein
MGLLAAGQVVIVHFPFSDLSQSKLRPAAVSRPAILSERLPSPRPSPPGRG